MSSSTVFSQLSSTPGDVCCRRSQCSLNCRLPQEMYDFVVHSGLSTVLYPKICMMSSFTVASQLSITPGDV